MRRPYMAACPRVMSRGHHSDCEAPHPTHGRSLSAWAGRTRPPLSFTLSGGRSHRKRSMGWRTTTRPLSRLRVPWAQATRPPHCLLAPPACGFAPTHGISVGGARADLPASGRRDTSPRPHRPKVRCGLTLRPRRATGHFTSATSRESRMSAHGPPAAACHHATPPWAHRSRPGVGARHGPRHASGHAALAPSLEAGCGPTALGRGVPPGNAAFATSPGGRMWEFGNMPRRAIRYAVLAASSEGQMWVYGLGRGVPSGNAAAATPPEGRLWAAQH
jgi:hypothetical protein